MEAEVSFGAWIVRRRQALDLTREQLAKCVGYSVSALRKIESDERRPSLQLAELLAEYLQIPPEQRSTFLQVARGHLQVERLAVAVPRPATGFEPSQYLPQSVLRLPAPPAPLIGRETELAALTRLLRDLQYGLLTLAGPGGIGKTRLALEVASSQHELFPDGVYFVSLASLSAPQFIVPAIADTLGFTFSGTTEPKTQLLTYLRKKCLLLVLDNFEHLLEGSELLTELLHQAPKTRLLVTSRERLNLQGEWVFEIQGLPVPPSDQARHVDEYSAVALFIQSARRAQVDFNLKAEEQAAVVHICQMVEGMPLGIELAAAWVSVLTCREIAREIERSMDFLATSMRDVPGRQRSLRATFDHSWNLLTADERSVMRRLALFQGGFVREAAEQVAGATLPLLLALVSKSLVHRAESGRYGLHEVVRQYTLAHLADDPQHEAARDRHCEFYLTLLRDQERSLKSTAQGQTIRELMNEIDNIRAAWAWAVEREKYGPIGQALRCFRLFFDLRGWLSEGIEQLDLVVQAIRVNSDKGERQKVLGQVLAQQGLLFSFQGHHVLAQALLEESLAILRSSSSDPVLLLDPLIHYGMVLYVIGEVNLAQSLLEEGLACAQTVGDHWFMAYATYNQGYTASLQGRYDEAYEQMSAGITIWRKLGDPRYTALGLNFLSPTTIKLGRYEEAQAFLQESLTLCQQIGDRWGMGTAYRFLGLAALTQGNIPEAQYFIHKSLELFTELGTHLDVARSLVFLGEIAMTESNSSEARRTFLQALSTAMELQAFPLALDALVGLAYLQARTGEAEQALELAICVTHHPASTQEAKDRAGQLGAELETELTPQKIEAVQARAQAKSLEVIVRELLNTP